MEGGDFWLLIQIVLLRSKDKKDNFIFQKNWSQSAHEGPPIVIAEGKSVRGKGYGGGRDIPEPVELYQKITIKKTHVRYTFLSLNLS